MFLKKRKKIFFSNENSLINDMKLTENAFEEDTVNARFFRWSQLVFAILLQKIICFGSFQTVLNRKIYQIWHLFVHYFHENVRILYYFSFLCFSFEHPVDIESFELLRLG